MPSTSASPRSDRGRNAGIGCLMTPVGFASGAMIAVLASKIVAFFTKAPSCPDIPTCNWGMYAVVGGVLGALTLPSLVLWRLAGPRSDKLK